MVSLTTLVEETIIETPENIQYETITLTLNERSGSTNTATINIYKSGSTTPEKTITLNLQANDTIEITLRVNPGRVVKGRAGSNYIEAIATAEQH